MLLSSPNWRILLMYRHSEMSNRHLLRKPVRMLTGTAVPIFERKDHVHPRDCGASMTEQDHAVITRITHAGSAVRCFSAPTPEDLGRSSRAEAERLQWA